MFHHPVKSGDIIGFSGRSLRSAGINIVTGGLPLWGISHVGIVGQSEDHRLFLFESVEDEQRCAVTGETFSGLQAHHLADVLANYNGRAWHYPLYRRLYEHEVARLSTFLVGSLGNKYDARGAVRSGGFLFALANHIAFGPDLLKKFCSETCVAGLSRIGIFPTSNASRWNPNKFIRTARWAGILKRPLRLK